MALIEIPLHLTYGVQESNEKVQVVTTAENGSILSFKGANREDATVVFKTWADTIIENGRYTRLRFDIVRSTIIGEYSPLQTHNGEAFELIKDTVPITDSNEFIVKASNQVGYVSQLGEGPGIRYDNDESQLLAIPFQQEHSSKPIVSIRPAQVIPTGSLVEMSNIEINAIYNNTGYLYYIVPVGPGKSHVHILYGASNAIPGEGILVDNTITHTLDEDTFSYAFATDVPLTSDDISRLESDPALIEDVWDSTVVDPFSFTAANMTDLTTSSSTDEVLKYLPFSAGVQLYRGIIRTSNHIQLSAGEDSSITYLIPEDYYTDMDTIYILYYDTDTQTWAQMARAGVTKAISEITVTGNHHGFTLVNRLLTRAEMTQLCMHANLLIKVFYDGYILEDGFKGSNIVRLFPGTEGLVGGDTVTDIVVGDTATITNYVPLIREGLVNLEHGVQDFYVEKNAMGVVTCTVLASKIRFDISYLNSRFVDMFKEYTIVDNDDLGNHRIRTYIQDNESTTPIVSEMYINGTEVPLLAGMVTPDLPVALDGAGFAITIGTPHICEFEVLPYYVDSAAAYDKYMQYRDNCVLHTVS